MNINDLKKKMIDEDQMVIYLITREEHIESFDVQTTIDFLNDFKKMGVLGMSKLSLMISGYDDDPRELIEIPEVRDYIKFLDKSFPYWFFFLEKNTPSKLNMLNFIYFCCVEVEIIAKGSQVVQLIPKDDIEVIKFFENHFFYLNELTDELKLSEEVNIEISRQVNKIFFGEEFSDIVKN